MNGYKSIERAENSAFWLKAAYKAYLVAMRREKKVHFVCFETALPGRLFIKRWELFKRSSDSDEDTTMQLSEKSGMFKYIVQHRLQANVLKFIFSKEEKHSRMIQERIKTTQIGGYSLLQAERLTDAVSGERKIFVFLKFPNVTLESYKNLSAHTKLNIYEAYYENCRYDFILEYFVKTKYASELLEQINKIDNAEMDVYTECSFGKKPKIPNQERDYA